MSINNLPEIEISVRYKNKVNKTDLIKINSSQDIASVCRKLINADTIDWIEEVVLICLNRANKVIGYYKVSQGGITGTVLDPKVVFTVALNTAGTTSIILCHNHPSGNTQPSEADDNLTKKIKAGGQLLDIKLLDHIIITDSDYYSYTDNGNL